jgi:hypothetical protein
MYLLLRLLRHACVTMDRGPSTLADTLRPPSSSSSCTPPPRLTHEGAGVMGRDGPGKRNRRGCRADCKGHEHVWQWLSGRSGLASAAARARSGPVPVGLAVKVCGGVWKCGVRGGRARRSTSCMLPSTRRGGKDSRGDASSFPSDCFMAA